MGVDLSGQNWFDNDDEAFGGEGENPYDANPESKTLKDLRKQLKELSRENKKLADEVSSQRAATRANALKKLVADQGYPDKVAGLLPHDIEPTEEAVKGWFSEYGEVFGAKSADRQEQEPEENREPDPGEEAIRRMQRTVNTGNPPGSRTEEVEAKFRDTSLTEEQFLELLRSQGAKV